MRDKISIERVESLHPKVRNIFKSFIEEIEATFNITVRVAQAGRTFAEQQAIWNEGRTTPGPNVRPGHPLGDVVTWAIPGTSYHNYFLAIDAIPFKTDGKTLDWNYDFHKWVPIATKYGITCGINFPPHKTDADHFELTFGHNWRQLLDKYHRGDFIEGTKYVNIF